MRAALPMPQYGRSMAFDQARMQSRSSIFCLSFRCTYLTSILLGAG